MLKDHVLTSFHSRQDAGIHFDKVHEQEGRACSKGKSYEVSTIPTKGVSYTYQFLGL